jgi:hypothetical protein
MLVSFPSTAKIPVIVLTSIFEIVFLSSSLFVTGWLGIWTGHCVEDLVFSPVGPHRAGCNETPWRLRPVWELEAGVEVPVPGEVGAAMWSCTMVVVASAC